MINRVSEGENLDFPNCITIKQMFDIADYQPHQGRIFLLKLGEFLPKSGPKVKNKC